MVSAVLSSEQLLLLSCCLSLIDSKSATYVTRICRITIITCSYGAIPSGVFGLTVGCGIDDINDEIITS